MTSTYDVTVTREGDFWVAQVAGVAGGATESRSLAALEGEVRDLLAGLLGVDEDERELRWDYRPALGEVADTVRKLAEARQRLVAAQDAYETAQSEAAQGLRSAKVSLRDAGQLVGLSFQRVQQLTVRRVPARLPSRPRNG